MLYCVKVVTICTTYEVLDRYSTNVCESFFLSDNESIEAQGQIWNSCPFQTKLYGFAKLGPVFKIIFRCENDFIIRILAHAQMIVYMYVYITRKNINMHFLFSFVIFWTSEKCNHC